jgi:transcriptional regulator with GAF, ATPase, and Fis domain
VNYQLQTPNTFAQWLSQTESPIFYLNYLFALMAGFITLSLFFIGHRLAQNIRLNTQEIKNTLKKMNTSTHSNHHCRYYHDNNCKRINITEFDALESDIESLHEAQSKRYFDLKIRSDTENLILSSLDKDHIIYTVLADIEHIIECDNAFFVLFNKRETNNHNIFTLHAHTDKLEQQPIELDSKSIFYSNKEPKPIFYAGLNNNLPDALMAYVEPYSHKGILPLRFDDKLFGMLLLTWHHDDAWNDSELQNAEDFCLKIGMALSNSALEDSLYKKNHFDKLTNLPNRLLFQDRLKQALLRSERSNNCTALMIIDIDNFSSVNESFGTHAGDSYLKDIA